MSITVITPRGMFGASDQDEALDTAMRLIAVAFAAPEEWASKYGTDYENDTFMMHRYCWCEREECPWCFGSAPNFLHKPSGFKVKWYKYIGRGMETEGKPPPDLLESVFASNPGGTTIEQAARLL